MEVEIAAEPQVRVCRYRTLSKHEFVDAAWRNLQGPGQRVLAHAHGLEQLLQQNLTRMRVWHEPASRPLLRMVVDDFDIFRPSVAPSKADTPLVVDANAVLAQSPPGQRLEAVAARRSQLREATSPGSTIATSASPSTGSTAAICDCRSPDQKRSVSRSRKLTIIGGPSPYNASRYMTQGVIAALRQPRHHEPGQAPSHRENLA